MRSFDDVWFGTLSETYDCRTEDSAALAPGQPPRAPGGAPALILGASGLRPGT
jgi:hypothetical protein